MTPRTVWLFNFTGWVFFTISAVGFTWTTWKSGDLVGLAASLFFLVACLIFMIPAWVLRPRKHD